MADLASRRLHIQSLLESTAEEHGLTGVVIGVLDGDEAFELATGWANRDARIEAAPDGIHQIGSITKVYVTTMLMRLVADGVIGLDDPVAGQLPELRLAGDPDLSDIRVRHLLTHMSGIGGDAFIDTGEGDEAVEHWVSALATVPLESAPGQRWSYCNTAFGLLGRILEKRTGRPFRRVLRDLITKPLDVLTPVVTAREALRFRVAIGHVPTDHGSTRTTGWARLPPSSGPAGSTPSARVADVLTFVRAHIDPGDERLAPRHLLDQMRDHHADHPDYMGAGQGLAWFREVLDPLVVGHGGSTETQQAWLVVCPARRFATIAFGNDLHGAAPIRSLTRTIWAELAGIALRPEPASLEPAPEVDIRPLCGTFRRFANTIDVFTDGLSDGPVLRVETVAGRTGAEQRRMTLENVAPSAADGHRWVGRDPLTRGPVTLDFREWADGRPAVLHSGGRANLRS